MSCCEKKPSKLDKIKFKVIRLYRRLKGDYSPKKSSMYKWAQSELDRLLTGNNDDNTMQKQMNTHIMKIVEEFCKEGHSGFSASYAIGIITKLLDWKPITPLTGELDEWGPVYEWGSGDNSQQNKRCSAVFRKNFDNSTAYYIDGKVFSDNGGITWFTGKGSRVPVIFPYSVPSKPEYIYLNGEDSEEIITDKEQIQKLAEEWRKSYE